MIKKIRALTLAGLMVLSIVTAGVAITGSAAAAGNTDAVIEGTITDPAGEPVADAWIDLLGNEGLNSTMTNATGDYSANVTDGAAYEVEFYQRNASVAYPNDGIVDFWSVGNVTAPARADEQLPEGHVLNVTVTNESGAPVGDASVLVRQQDGAEPVPLSSQTNENGVFAPNGSDASGVEVNGTVTVYVYPPSDRDLRSKTRELTVDTDTNLTVALPETVNVSGSIALTNGSVSSTDQVQWRARNDADHVATESLNADGSYETALLINTTYAAQYRQSPPRSSASTVYPTDGSPDVYSMGQTTTGTTDSWRLDGLPSGSNLSIRVVDETGDPVSNASLSIVHHNDGISTRLTAPTNANGYGEHPDSDGPGFDLAGDVEIIAQPPKGSNYEPNATQLSISESRTVEVVLAQNNNVSGQWVGPDGDPISGARVNAVNFSIPATDKNETDADGNFDLTLPDGTYTVSVDPQVPNDGVADHAAVDGVAVNGDTDGGTFSVPRGYNVTLDAVDQRGRTVDAHVHACDYDALWCYEYGTGRDLDNLYSWANGETREIANGTVQVDVYDSWTHDRLGGRNVTVDGAPVSETLSVDRLNGTDVPAADGFSVVRDLESESFTAVDWLLQSDVNVRLWTLNSTASTTATITEELPDGYELNDTYGVVADGSGSIRGVDYDAGSNVLTFDLDGNVTQVRYRVRPTDGGRDSAAWSGAYDDGSGDADVAGDSAISAAAEPDESDDTDDGGSSAGGGGAPPQNLEDPLGMDAHVSTTLDGATVSVVRGEDGGSATADLPSTAAVDDVAFDELGVTLAADESAFDLDVAASDEAPDDVTPPADRAALGYLSVKKEGVDDDAIANATIGFTVDETDLPEGASLDDVRLYHDQNDEWVALPTQRNGTAFVAKTDGFSAFAVGVAAPDLSVTAASVETDEVAVGGRVTVSATVANEGSLDGNQTVAVTTDGETLASTNVTVAAGETRTVEVPVTLDDSGTVDLAVAGIDAGTVEVSTETTADTASTTTDDADAASDGQPGFGAVAALLALVVAALLGRRDR